ncbi:MAG: rod shape-determining protein [Lachnospiraceae bacterium]|nr:rod shape-determining protein [Lachnospiraceae bacterium]
MTNNAFGIDLGTSNIRIYELSSDQIHVQKNMIAIANKKELFAYGDSAYDMYEKAPGNISITYPLNNGVIADINNMETILRYYVNDITKGQGSRQADYYVAVPTDITDVEKRAFYDLITDSKLKARKVMTVEKALADGLGQGIDVKTSQGVMVVDVGFDTTEISILSLGGIVLSRLIKMGGGKFDESIRACVRKEMGLLIGLKTAEQVKMALKELLSTGRNAIVYGRDIVTGLPVERELPTDMMEECLQENFNAIIDNVKQILERTPPELSADIFRNGIFLTGGASDVADFTLALTAGTQLKVNVSEEPIKSVALGLSRIIKDENFRSLAKSAEDVRQPLA